MRDDVRGYVVDALGDPAGVLILDDTGDLRKGESTIGTTLRLATGLLTGRSDDDSASPGFSPAGGTPTQS